MKKIGINDFTFYNYPTGITASPDGKHAAIAVVNANEKDNTYDSCLWIHDTESKKTRKLTSGKKERTFIWLDNETLLFTSDREKEYAKKVKDGPPLDEAGYLKKFIESHGLSVYLIL